NAFEDACEMEVVFWGLIAERIVTEKVYESESCTDSEEELKMKTSSVHRPPAMTVKKEPREERKGPKKGTAALGKANRQVSITGFFQRK
ncbi:POLD3 isoform 10, partial [Pan troglodytes]